VIKPAGYPNVQERSITKLLD